MQTDNGKLAGSVSIASSGKVASLISGFYHREYHDFSRLGEAERDAGFQVKAVETFQNGYTFSEVSLHDTKGVDKEGNEME